MIIVENNEGKSQVYSMELDKLKTNKIANFIGTISKMIITNNYAILSIQTRDEYEQQL